MMQYEICDISVRLDFCAQLLDVTLRSDGAITRFGLEKVTIGSDDGTTRFGLEPDDEIEAEVHAMQDRLFAFSGKIELDVFERLRARITPELWGWCGKVYSDLELGKEPQSLSKRLMANLSLSLQRMREKRTLNSPDRFYTLILSFRTTDGELHVTGARYRAQSSGPPAEMFEFMDAVVEATNPWFARQLALDSQGQPSGRIWPFYPRRLEIPNLTSPVSQ